MEKKEEEEETLWSNVVKRKSNDCPKSTINYWFFCHIQSLLIIEETGFSIFCYFYTMLFFFLSLALTLSWWLVSVFWLNSADVRMANRIFFIRPTKYTRTFNKSNSFRCDDFHCLFSITFDIVFFSFKLHWIICTWMCKVRVCVCVRSEQEPIHCSKCYIWLLFLFAFSGNFGR